MRNYNRNISLLICVLLFGTSVSGNCAEQVPLEHGSPGSNTAMEDSASHKLQMLWQATVGRSKELQALLIKAHGSSNVPIEKVIADKTKMGASGRYKLEDSEIFPPNTLKITPKILMLSDRATCAQTCSDYASKVQSAYLEFERCKNPEERKKAREVLVEYSGEEAVLHLQDAMEKRGS